MGEVIELDVNQKKLGRMPVTKPGLCYDLLPALDYMNRGGPSERAARRLIYLQKEDGIISAASHVGKLGARNIFLEYLVMIRGHTKEEAGGILHDYTRSKLSAP